MIIFHQSTERILSISSGKTSGDVVEYLKSKEIIEFSIRSKLKYEGQFFEERFHGQGSLTNSLDNFMIYEGIFFNGNPENPGEFSTLADFDQTPQESQNESNQGNLNYHNN